MLIGIINHNLTTYTLFMAKKISVFNVIYSMGTVQAQKFMCWKQRPFLALKIYAK